PARRGRRYGRERLRGLHRRPGGAPPVLHRPRRRLGRPRRDRCRHGDPARGRAGTVLCGGAGPAGHRGRGDRPAAPPAHRDGADVLRGRPGDDHSPRRAAQPPHAHLRDLWPRRRLRHSHRRGVHRLAAAPAGGLRHAPEPAPGAVHHRRDHLLARARAAGRFLSLGVRGRAVVVHRRSRCDPPVPRSGDRARRVLPHQRLHRRHPGVLLHPRPARYEPQPGRRLSRRARGRPSYGRGRGTGGTARPCGGQSAARVQTGGALSMNQRLRRGLPGTPETSAPVRIVHLGVGNFHRAHQAWYTQHAPDAQEWGIAAFTGRRPDQAEALAPQDGLYTLLTKAPEGDRAEIISSLVAVHPASEHEQYLNYLARASTAVVTLTLTEQAYRRDARGHLDTEDDGVAGDLQVLRTDPRGRVSSMPARIVAGLLARRSAGAGPLTILPCDNLPDNGRVLRTLVLDAAAAVDPALAGWVEDQVDFATSMVDRITPAITDEDRDLALRLTGYADAAPVQTEPFSEWVISGQFPAGRPDWEPAGVR